MILMSADGFDNIWLFFVETIGNKVSAWSFELLTSVIVKILPVTLFKKLVQSFR
jgi:hypothetical protein